MADWFLFQLCKGFRVVFTVVRVINFCLKISDFAKRFKLSIWFCKLQRYVTWKMHLKALKHFCHLGNHKWLGVYIDISKSVIFAMAIYPYNAIHFHFSALKLFHSIHQIIGFISNFHSIHKIIGFISNFYLESTFFSLFQKK